MSNEYQIHMATEPYIKVCRILYEMDDEFLFVMLGRRDGRKFDVQDVLIPYQEVSAAYCEITNKGLLELNEVNDRIIGWGHAHPDFAAFHSTTDTKTADSGAFIFPPFASLTVSRKGNWDGRIFTKRNNKEGIKAELWLPRVVPHEKFKQKKWYQPVVSIVKGTKPSAPTRQPRSLPFDTRPWWQQRNQQTKFTSIQPLGPTIQSCGRCTYFKKEPSLCTFEKPTGTELWKIQVCPLEKGRRAYDYDKYDEYCY